MPPDLCNTFFRLACETNDRLHAARSVGHQLLEETLTDLIILELKQLHPKEIYCQTFTKPQEGKNGADWEWWLTDPTRSRWLGLRVQAKVLELKSNTFAHLHYQQQGGTYQSTLLKKAAEQDGLFPLYCLYANPPVTAVGWEKYAPSRAYGCAIASVKCVERLRKKGKLNDFVSVMSDAIPWNFLVCFGETWSSSGRVITFPDAVANLLMGSSSLFKTDTDELATVEQQTPLRPGVRKVPPRYVSALLEGQPSDDVGKALRGVLVIQGPPIDNVPLESFMGKRPRE